MYRVCVILIRLNVKFLKVVLLPDLGLWRVNGRFLITEGKAGSSFEYHDKILVPHERDRVSSWSKNLGWEQITSQQGLILQQGVNL